MVPDDVLDEIESVAERLGPRAKRIRTSYPRSTPDEVLDTDGSTSRSATRSPRWRREIAESEGEHGHEPAAGQHEHDHAEGRRRGLRRRLVRLPLGRRPRSRVVRELAPRLGRRDCAGEGCRQRRGDGRGHRRESGRSSVQAGPIGEWGPTTTAARDSCSSAARWTKRGSAESLTNWRRRTPESVENADAFRSESARSTGPESDSQFRLQVVPVLVESVGDSVSAPTADW